MSTLRAQIEAAMALVNEIARPETGNWSDAIPELHRFLGELAPIVLPPAPSALPSQKEE